MIISTTPTKELLETYKKEAMKLPKAEIAQLLAAAGMSHGIEKVKLTFFKIVLLYASHLLLFSINAGFTCCPRP